MNALASAQLGGPRNLKGNQIAWARRMLRKGYCVSRHGWALEASPKRCFWYLGGSREVEYLCVRREDGSADICAATWQDICATDFYIAQQLELSK